MVVRFSRRRMLTAATAAVLAPVGGFADTPTAPTSTPGLRTFRVYVEDCLQVTLRCPDVASAMSEAEAYRQVNDDVCVWEGSRIVGTLTAKIGRNLADVGPPSAAYNFHGLPRAVVYLGQLATPPEPRRGWSFIHADNDAGWFAFIDLRPAEQLDAMDRFMKGDRDPETWDLMLRATAGLP